MTDWPSWPTDRMTKWPNDWVSEWPIDQMTTWLGDRTGWKEALQTIDHMVYFTYQVCRVDLQVEKFARRNVELLPDTMDLLSDTELTQYFIQRWSLEYHDPSKGEFTILCSICALMLFIRSPLCWSEDGDCIQAAADQRAADHLPPLPAPAADVLRHSSL